MVLRRGDLTRGVSAIQLLAELEQRVFGVVPRRCRDGVRETGGEDTNQERVSLFQGQVGKWRRRLDKSDQVMVVDREHDLGESVPAWRCRAHG
jgi:hypothetical protein